MDNKELKKMWSLFLVDSENTNQSIADDLGTSPQNLGKKINNGSIRFIEMCNIVEKYGYKFEMKKNPADVQQDK